MVTTPTLEIRAMRLRASAMRTIAVSMPMALMWVAFTVRAEPRVVAGATTEFRVEVPEELRDFDRSGRLTSARAANVVVAAPVDFDPGRQWPVLLISAGSDPGSNSRRRLLEHYRQRGQALAEAAGHPLRAQRQVREHVPGQQFGGLAHVGCCLVTES